MYHRCPEGSKTCGYPCACARRSLSHLPSSKGATVDDVEREDPEVRRDPGGISETEDRLRDPEP